MQLSSLKLNDSNPRLIKDDKFKKLCDSIKSDPDFLKLRPIIYDADRIVIAGNMRFRALQELGYTEIPNEWAIPATGLTKEQIRKFIVIDNLPYGEWDWDALTGEYDTEELTEWGVDLPDYINSREAVEDDFEIPEEVETDIVTGDLFEIGQHRLLCGDSTDTDSVANLMNGEKADMVFTDPPYGVSIGAKNRFLNSFQPSGRNLNDIKDDTVKPDDLYKMLLPAFINIRESSKPDCTYFVTSPQGGGIGMMMMMMIEAGLEVRHVLIWKKNSPTFSMGRLDYDYAHEPIFLTWTKKHHWYGAGTQKTSVWEFDKPRSNKEHPTMKPVALIGNALLNNSKDRDLVIDFFLGSGSTMVAAHQLNRKCYGIEIDSKYCHIIILRMLKLAPELAISRNGVDETSKWAGLAIEAATAKEKGQRIGIKMVQNAVS